MKYEIEVIHIIWEGPLTPAEAAQKQGATDYGVYQIYGTHETTGPDSLIYVGQADANTFHSRINSHQEEWARWNAQEIKVHLGRIATSSPVSENEWTRLIDKAEAVLIWKIGVPYNSARIKSLKYGSQPILVVNHGRRHRLPECLSTVTEFHNQGTLQELGSQNSPVQKPAPLSEMPAEKFG